MSLGYINKGKYYTGDAKPELPSTNATFKGWDHDQQRQDHKWELVQPWTRQGEPNPEFTEAFPEEAKQYGFITDEED